MKRLHCIVRGRVQGVFYRASTEREALRLGLDGWVRNLYDGSVELTAEGDEGKLEELLAWCRRGPRGARVETVEPTWETPTGDLEGFHVR